MPGAQWASQAGTGEYQLPAPEASFSLEEWGTSPTFTLSILPTSNRAQALLPPPSLSTYSRQETGYRPGNPVVVSTTRRTIPAPRVALEERQGSGQRSQGPLATPISHETEMYLMGEGGDFSSSIRPSSPALPRLGGIVLLRRTGAGRPPACWGPTRLCGCAASPGNTMAERRGRQHHCNQP